MDRIACMRGSYRPCIVYSFTCYKGNWVIFVNRDNALVLYPQLSMNFFPLLFFDNGQWPVSSISVKKLSQAFLVMIPLNTPLASVTSNCLAPSLTKSCCTSSRDECVWTVMGA